MLGVLFIGALVAQAGYEIWRSHGEAVRSTERDLATQSRVIAEQTARGVQAADVVLKHLADQIQRGVLSLDDPLRLHLALKEEAAGLVQSDGVVAFTADGRLRAASQVPPGQMINLDVGGERPFPAVRSQRPGEGVVIGNVRVSPGSGLRIFPIGRRVDAQDGKFAGVVGAPGRVDYFQDFYRESYPDPDTRISLVHREGWLLARHPPADAVLGKRLDVLERLLPSGSGLTHASARVASPVDGADYFVALRAVPGYPLVVAVARDARAALAPWRAQALGTTLRTLGLGALAGGLLWAALRQLARAQAARRSLEISEERLTLAMTGSDEGHWLWDIAAGQVFVSEKLAALFGLPGGARTMVDEDYFAAIPLHAADRERVHHNRNEHVAGRTPRLDHEFRIVAPATGEVRWTHTRAQCFRDADGRPLRMAGSTVDITHRKRAEEALRESEARFAVAVAGSGEGLWVWNFATGQGYASPRCREISGLPPGPDVQPIEAWFTQTGALVHPDDKARWRATLEDHLAGITPVADDEFRVQRAGEWRWVRARGMCERGADGKPLRVAGSLSDVDARKRAEEALRESQQRFAVAVAGADAGIWEWDFVQGTAFNSQRGRLLLGLSPQPELQTLDAWKAELGPNLHPEDAPRREAALAEHLAGRSDAYDIDIRVHRADGSWRWVHVHGRCERDPDGRPLRMAGSASDIEPRKRAEAERLRLEEQLRQAQKLEAIGTLAGGIAHDFNNILSAILGYGELAHKGAAEGSAQRRHIEAALAAGQRAKSLVERILAFSRGGVGERVPVHVQSTVDEALESLRPTWPAGIRLERSLCAGDAGVLGDPTQIHQVVLNLCANAAQATRAPGRVSVRLDLHRLDAPLALATGLLAPGDFVRLVVADTGSGMPAALLERIFDPFFTTKEVGVGTGLGLSLVHGIVIELGGGIDVRSAEGQGSTFTVYLPARATVAAPRHEASEVLERGHGQCVLLVDDEEALVRLGEETLAELGYEPVGFTSSTAALDALRADPTRFDLLLSDEAMPGLSGSELAAQARALRPELPIVMMSGFVTAALLDRARELAVSQVLNKPLVARDVAQALAAALRGELRMTVNGSKL